MSASATCRLGGMGSGVQAWGWSSSILDYVSMLLQAYPESTSSHLDEVHVHQHQSAMGVWVLEEQASPTTSQNHSGLNMYRD